MNDTFSGECELRIRPAEDVAYPDWEVLTTRWEAWITAIEAGMFPPGQIAAAPEKLALEGAALTVQSVPAVAFRVLNGILRQFSVGWARLECWSLRDRRTGANLLNAEAPFPGPPPGVLALPLETGPRGFGENTSIVIEFAHSIDASSRERIVKTLEAWTALLWGGYPVSGEPPEECGVAGNVRFLDPSTATIHMEFWGAAPECTTPLIHLLYRWHDRYPVERAYVEP
jgi:hypothetical protein